VESRATAGTVEASLALKRHPRLAFDLIFQRPVEDIDDLFARMYA
jgi:hypothetical protein